MANVLMNQTPKLMASGSLDLLNDTLKIMLCNSTYVPDKDDTFIDDGSADDAASGEIVTVTNYAGGFGGAGRKTLASKTSTQDNTNDRAQFDADNPTWATLGGAANDTVRWAALIKEITDDTDSLVLAAYELNQLTNGSNFTLTIDALGLLVFRQAAA